MYRNRPVFLQNSISVRLQQICCQLGFIHEQQGCVYVQDALIQVKDACCIFTELHSNIQDITCIPTETPVYIQGMIVLQTPQSVFLRISPAFIQQKFGFIGGYDVCAF